MKIGRNDPCHCGSGKKYKRCCLQADRMQARVQPAVRAESSLEDELDVGTELGRL